ncbi:MAG: hypothetical protein L0241_12730 [Planctomycetia bacterium]|nr:hypothetical protein [Planctomycetia bacterium]
MPDWLIDIFRQFPIVVVIGFVIWYAEKRVRDKEIRLETRFDDQSTDLLKRDEERERQLRAREDQLRAEARADRDAEIQRFLDAQRTLTRTYEKLLTAKDEQIANLTQEVERLTRQLAALTKKLQR